MSEIKKFNLLRRTDPGPYLNMGVITLAKLTHKAEYEGDDIAFLQIQDVIEGRSETEQRVYREAYLRTWPESHKKYGGKA
jgi:hypothetical protein